MLNYVVKLTKDATKVWKDDIDGLRAVGFDDRGILQITLIASRFNYINRVADALGVGRVEQIAHRSSPSFIRFRQALAFVGVHPLLRFRLCVLGLAARRAAVGKAGLVRPQLELF
jgi:hypothetical protein